MTQSKKQQVAQVARGDIKELMTTSFNGYTSCNVKNHHGEPLAGSYHLAISLPYLGGEVVAGFFLGTK